MKEAHVKKIRKKPLQCPHCEYLTNRKTYLIRHVEKRHNNNKPNFSCNICNKSFNRKDNLKRHIKTHEEKKTIQYGGGCENQKEDNEAGLLDENNSVGRDEDATLDNYCKLCKLWIWLDLNKYRECDDKTCMNR